MLYGKERTQNMQQELNKVLEWQKKYCSWHGRGNSLMGNVPAQIPRKGASELATSKCNSTTTCRRAVLLMFVSTLIGAVQCTCSPSFKKRKPYILSIPLITSPIISVVQPISLLFICDIKNDVKWAQTEFSHFHQLLPVQGLARSRQNGIAWVL